jgi:small subunit ribosomal protein S24e
MEVIIESKKNNTLLNRTEVFFTVKHTGAGTPNRDIIRNELADKLNTTKDNVVINEIHSGFGTQEATGYAKIYNSTEQSKGLEHKHILVRNKIIEKEIKKKGEKKTKEKTEKQEGKAEKTSEPQEKAASAEPKKEEKSNKDTESKNKEKSETKEEKKE